MEYDKLEWLGAEHRDDLLTDLQQRTGLDVVKVQIRNIDLPRTTATLTVWCNELEAPAETASQDTTQ